VVFKRGIVGALLRVAAGVYLVYVADPFAQAKAIIEEYRVAAASVTDAAAAFRLLEALTVTLTERLLAGAPHVAAALAAWIIGTILFSSSWNRLASAWPEWVRRFYFISVWALRAAAIGGGIATYLILSRASGEVAQLLEALRISWLLAALYAAPLLSPVIYTTLSLLYPPRGRRAGLALLLVGAALYAYSVYSVVTAFRPLSQVAPLLNQLAENPLGLEAGEVLASLLAAAEIAVDRLEGTVKALIAASLAYAAGFTLSEAGDERLAEAAKKLVRLPGAATLQLTVKG